jgi:hypothetical protein
MALLYQQTMRYLMRGVAVWIARDLTGAFSQRLRGRSRLAERCGSDQQAQGPDSSPVRIHATRRGQHRLLASTSQSGQLLA